MHASSHAQAKSMGVRSYEHQNRINFAPTTFEECTSGENQNFAECIEVHHMLKSNQVRMDRKKNEGASVSGKRITGYLAKTFPRKSPEQAHIKTAPENPKTCAHLRHS